MVGQPLGQATLGRHDEDIVVAEARSGKCNLLTVRAEDRIALIGFVDGEPGSFTPDEGTVQISPWKEKATREPSLLMAGWRSSIGVWAERAETDSKMPANMEKTLFISRI